MAAEKVRFGVIGTGGMGSGHCNMIPKIPETRLTAVCDIDPQICASIAAQYEVPGFTNHLELLDSGLVDAVVIATPHYFHPPIAIDAFFRDHPAPTEIPTVPTLPASD